MKKFSKKMARLLRKMMQYQPRTCSCSHKRFGSWNCPVGIQAGAHSGGRKVPGDEARIPGLSHWKPDTGTQRGEEVPGLEDHKSED